jgi:hypothetical protein
MTHVRSILPAAGNDGSADSISFSTEVIMSEQAEQNPRATDTDNDSHKGAIESDKPNEQTQASMAGQLPHRDQDPRIKGQDTDFPEPGENPEYSGERQEPGFSQKTNQNDQKDDPLAA